MGVRELTGAEYGGIRDRDKAAIERFFDSWQSYSDLILCGMAKTGRKPFTFGDKIKAFSDKIEDGENGCWNWTGDHLPTGYGFVTTKLGYKRTRELSHRFSWQLFRGFLTPSVLVCHRCDNPRCVNPEHLFVGSHADNNRDMRAKGRDDYGACRGTDHPFSKLTDGTVREIRKLREEGVTIEEVARRFSVSRGLVYKVAKRIVWRHVV